MKKIVLSLLASLLVFSLSAQPNLLLNGDMEEQGAWEISQGITTDPISYTFGSTENTVNGGEGANLAIKMKAQYSATTNFTAYQELNLIGGKEYEWSCAMRDLTTDHTCWWIKYVWIALEPVDDNDPDEETIWQMHEWMGDNKILGFDGLMDTCTAGIPAESKTNIFIPEADATYYVGINFGTCDSIGDYHFIVDEISMVDPNAVGINPAEYDDGNTFKVYPNPATTTINFSYNVRENSDVELTLINILGQEIKSVFRDTRGPGTYKETLDCSNLTNGMYYGVLRMNEGVIKKKILILR